MDIKFVGGAGAVTGACYLLKHNNTKILVDCGLHQGSKEEEKSNYNTFPFNIKEINALFVTHAHIDHTGRIPKLLKDGFRGPIYSTVPTKEAAYELLMDAHHLMSQELSEGELPLYDIKDIDDAISVWKTVEYRKEFTLGDFKVEYYDAGHILGSASIKISTISGRSVAFSGDLGNIPSPMVKDTDYIEKADYALIESAYGNRVHEPASESIVIIEDLIEDVVKSNGILMIPAFAMERTQQLLYEIDKLIEGGRIPKITVFVDSPLAIRLTEIYKKYAHNKEYFDKEFLEAIKTKNGIFNLPSLRFTLTKEESKSINDFPAPKVIIAGSGMSNGGRILHHEKRYLSDPNSSILFVGYQAKGTLGRHILEGSKMIRIFGEEVPVNARVKAIGGYSAHADQPLLLRWIDKIKGGLKKVFVVQGEPDQSTPLADRIKDTLAIDAIVPEDGYEEELS